MSVSAKDKVPPIKVADLKKKHLFSGSWSKSDLMKVTPSSKSVSPPKGIPRHSVSGVTPVRQEPSKSQMDLVLASMECQNKMFEGLAASLGNLVGQQQPHQQLARQKLVQPYECEP